MQHCIEANAVVVLCRCFVLCGCLYHVDVWSEGDMGGMLNPATQSCEIIVSRETHGVYSTELMIRIFLCPGTMS